VRTTILVAALAAFGGLARPTAEPQQTPTFKKAVNIVPINATVRDRRGRMVTTLTSADFEVLDKGERRPIIDFQVDHSGPITIAALLDVSGSMRIGPKMALASQVLRRLTAELIDGQSEIGLFTFDAALHEKQPFTTVPTAIEGALTTAEPFGSTSLYDAIAETARRLEARSSQRRAIVVLTDGIDTSSSLTPAEVSALASSIDVPIYIVITVPPIDREHQVASRANRGATFSVDLTELAVWTGGDLLWATVGEDTHLRADQILTELRHQYLIAIPSATEREWRPIDVRVRDQSLKVRARSGYFSSDNPAIARPQNP
jgi:Ca-activated chloride channel family protein